MRRNLFDIPAGMTFAHMSGDQADLTTGVSRRRFLATGAAGVGTASFAGCLGSLGGGADSVTVGFALPYSGTYALLGESITNGFKMRVDQLDGTLGGLEVEYTQQDTEGDPSAGASATQSLVNEEQVDFVVGPVSSAVAGAMASIIDDAASAIWLCANAGNDNIIRESCSKYFFRTSFSNWTVSAPMGPWVYENISDNLVLSYADYAAGQQDTANFRSTYEEAGGTVVEEVGAPLGTSDYSPYLQQIRDADADAIWSFFAGGDAVNYIKQLHQDGIDQEKTQAGPGFLLSADVIPAQGEAALGKYSMLHYTPWKDSPRNNEFVSNYESAHDRMPNVYACQGYDSALIADSALEAANVGDLDGLVSAIEGMEVEETPRDYLKIDADRHDPETSLDIRQVVEADDGSLMNEVVETLGRYKVPFTCDV
jgi:branched-chain amino acid transport system substrate-binding protein